MNGPTEQDQGRRAGTHRRDVLRLGSLGVAAVITIRPAFADTGVSILNCEIAVPDSRGAGQYVAADGSLVPAGTPGAFPPAARPFKGEDVKSAMRGRGPLPGTSFEQSDAYIHYIQRLQSGQGGFTCFASLTTR